MPCPECGSPVIKSGVRGRPKVYCSARCYQRKRERSRPPRPAGRRQPRACEVCSAEYAPTYHEQRTCSRECGAELRRRVYGFAGKAPKTTFKNSACRVWFRNCDVCGKLFAARSPRTKRCGPECSYQQLLASVHARHAHGVGAPCAEQEQITLEYLIRRDKGRCGICRKSVRARKGPMRASIDHIIPLARGGTHSLANVQLAHLRCNQSKNCYGGGEQLLLVG